MAIFPNTWFTNVCNFGLQAYWNERFFGFFFLSPYAHIPSGFIVVSLGLQGM